VTYIFYAEEIARKFALAIAPCDHQALHQSARNRVLGKKKMTDMFDDIGNVTIVAEGVVETVVPVLREVSKSNTKRIGNCGRKRKEDGELPSNKLKKTTHGASSFLEYQEVCKTEAVAASIRIRDANVSYRGAAKSMKAALMAKGVSLHESTCRKHVMAAIANG